ncbi:MAG: heavy-metal-associated domain-containing protein [Nitrospirota bacterium]|nr:heavy-metal-associated domain-containing protein [Nitrospirota bacterium]
MQTTLKVDGMTCNGCVNNVTNVLRGLLGVKDVKVSLESGLAVVTHEEAVAVPILIGAVEAAGYEATHA